MAKRLEFAYSELRDAQGISIFRPLLNLQLEYRGKSLDAKGLLDTGADVNVLPYKLGLSLGAKWEKARTGLNLSGNLANFEARGLLLDVTVADLSPVKLAFAWTRAEHVPLILGQVNFFMAFDVCFFRSRQMFELSLAIK